MDIWAKLEQLEQAETGGEPFDDFIPAYDVDEDYLANSDEEVIPDYGYGSDPEEDDDLDTEFKNFTEHDPDDVKYLPSYTQLEHLSYADSDALGLLVGKSGKHEKIAHAQNVSKEKLYINKFKVDLGAYFESFDLINHYADKITNIPRYWLKNSEALAAGVEMYHKQSGGKLNKNNLMQIVDNTGLRGADLLRYYRLIQAYF